MRPSVRHARILASDNSVASSVGIIWRSGVGHVRGAININTILGTIQFEAQCG
jgi:hypothetical protein